MLAVRVKVIVVSDQSQLAPFPSTSFTASDDLTMDSEAQISSLESKVKQQESQIVKLRRELDEARWYINALTRPKHANPPANDEQMELDEEEGQKHEQSDADDDDEQFGSAEHDSEGEQVDDTEHACLPEVGYFGDVYACSECGFEVLDGFCHSYACGQEHQWPPKEPLDKDYSIRTTSLSIHPDRSRVPRGTTPLREVDSSCNPIPPPEYRYSCSNWPKISPDRTEEYMQLLKRGATRLMCETFHLEYTHEGGIYAWADPEIFEEFAGPLMQKGDFWKIHLGRQIQLDEDDLDGSVFIEDLLEDAVMFPMHKDRCSSAHEQWETKEEAPGVWVTRLKAYKEDDPDEEAQSDGFDSDCDSECSYSSSGPNPEDLALEQPPAGGAVALNEYLPTSDEDDEQSLGDGDISMKEDDSDDYASPNSCNSDSEDVEVYDTAFASLAGPDQVWNSDMEDSSEDEVSQVLDGKGTP